jgi:two-component system phosphate regulon sensor histidine kinase PhoR
MGNGSGRWWAAAAAVLVCAAAGWLVGTLARSAIAGLLCAAAVAMALMLLSDSWRGARLLAWLRADAEGEPPETVGAWGETGHHAYKALRRRESQIQAERDRLTQFLAAVEASPIGVLLLDANQQISWCSRVAADHLGLDPRRDLGQPVTNLVRAPAFVEHLTAAHLSLIHI